MVNAAKQQVAEWTRRITRMLDRSERTRKDPLYRDLFVWMVPGSVFSGELERMVRELSLDRTLSPSSAGILGPPPAHVMQSMGEEPEERIREERLGFREVAAAERRYLAEGAKRMVEKQWLLAMIREAGLDPLFNRLQRAGVEFRFLGTMASSPMRWGQQAILPDGRSLLVLLHVSTPDEGLAFVHFGAPVEDDYGSKTHLADAVFHAKGLPAILKYLSLGPREP